MRRVVVVAGLLGAAVVAWISLSGTHRSPEAGEGVSPTPRVASAAAADRSSATPERVASDADRARAPIDRSPLATRVEVGDAIDPRGVSAEAPSLSRVEHEVDEALSGQGDAYLAFEGDAIVGLLIRSVREGSRFEAIELEAGDVITHLNGLAIDSPDAAQRVVPELIEAQGHHVFVQRDGRSLHLHRIWN